MIQFNFKKFRRLFCKKKNVKNVMKGEVIKWLQGRRERNLSSCMSHWNRSFLRFVLGGLAQPFEYCRPFQLLISQRPEGDDDRTFKKLFPSKAPPYNKKLHSEKGCQFFLLFYFTLVCCKIRLITVSGKTTKNMGNK